MFLKRKGKKVGIEGVGPLKGVDHGKGKETVLWKKNVQLRKEQSSFEKKRGQRIVARKGKSRKKKTE